MSACWREPLDRRVAIMSQHKRVTAPRLQTPSVVRLPPVSRAATHDERWPAVAVARPAIVDALRRAGQLVIGDGDASPVKMAA